MLHWYCKATYNLGQFFFPKATYNLGRREYLFLLLKTKMFLLPLIFIRKMIF